MKVIKFGGSSMADAKQFKKVANIVLSDPERRVVVVSAPGKRGENDTKVTDLLISLAETVRDGGDIGEGIDEVVTRFESIAKDLKLDRSIIVTIRADIISRIANRNEEFPKFLDSMKAAGEDNCAKLMAAYLKSRGHNAEYVNPKDAGLLLTQEFGNAQVLPESYDLLKKLLDRKSLVIFPGFFGYSKEGDVVTFSRGGSDVTGGILAAALNADVYENFTDVDSVYPVDPRVVPDVKRGIPTMTYREMRELAYAGFGVFHDEAVRPVVKAGIPINVRNTNHPELPGTMIVQSRRVIAGGVVGIASDDGFCNLYVDKYMMNRAVGFVRRLLQILEECGVAYDHMPSGIDSVSVIIRTRNLNGETEKIVMDRIRNELHPDSVTLTRGYAMIMVVGEGLYYTVGMAARATRALAEAGVNIELMSQGSSEISIVFGIKAEQRNKAVRSLYNEFFNLK